MPRRSGAVLENNFRGGLVTEATGLNFPPNACTETWNCVFDEKGRVYRRLAFDYESPKSTVTDSREGSVITGYTWTNVDGDGGVTLRVQQIGDTLYFYNLVNPGSLSTTKITATVDLNTYAASVDVSPENNECQFASANGFLIVVHPECEPFYITFNTATEAITATQITVNIRDLEGVDDSLDIDERPTATVAGLTATHKYNLFNQGWYHNNNAALTAWDTAHTTMPSNADVWWYYKDSSGAFDAAQIANYEPGYREAPKGHYLLNVFSEDRSTVSGIGSLDLVTTEDVRFSTVAFLNSRVFYGGLGYPGYSSNIYVSRIIEDEEDYGKCYQANDPTAEDLFDLLPDDGGVIPVLGLESCIKLWPYQNFLFIFATNGIWALTGSEGIGYSATDYTIQKISSVGSISANSFVDVDGLPIWWGLDGIYRLVPGQGGFQAQSLTDETIRTFYKDTVTTASKRLARGAYNSDERVIRWVYPGTAPANLEETYKMDRVLSFNVLTGAFYPWSLSTDLVTVHDCFVIRGDGGSTTLESATTTEGFEILDFTGDPVVTTSNASSVFPPRFKYFVSAVSGDNDLFTFAENTRTTYLDWLREDGLGEEYSSYFITGYRIDGEAQRFFQSNYINVFLETDANASAYMQGLWDWTNSSDSNRWSSLQQLYNSRQTNRALNHRRLKVRGKGKSLQLRFESDSTAPFVITGWSIFETQNSGI